MSKFSFVAATFLLLASGAEASEVLDRSTRLDHVPLFSTLVNFEYPVEVPESREDAFFQDGEKVKEAPLVGNYCVILGGRHERLFGSYRLTSARRRPGKDSVQFTLESSHRPQIIHGVCVASFWQRGPKLGDLISNFGLRARSGYITLFYTGKSRAEVSRYGTHGWREHRDAACSRAMALIDDFEGRLGTALPPMTTVHCGNTDTDELRGSTYSPRVATDAELESTAHSEALRSNSGLSYHCKFLDATCARSFPLWAGTEAASRRFDPDRDEVLRLAVSSDWL